MEWFCCQCRALSAQSADPGTPEPSAMNQIFDRKQQDEILMTMFGDK
jgi:hypothetical protein